MSLIIKEKIIEDLKQYAKRFNSGREFARASGVNREKVRVILDPAIPNKDKPSIELDDLFALLTACKVNPVKYLYQLLAESERDATKAEDADIKTLRKGLQHEITRPTVQSTVNIVKDLLGLDMPLKKPPKKQN